MFVLFLIAALPALASTDPGPLATPDWLVDAVKRSDAAMATVASGRRLAAASADVPVEPVRPAEGEEAVSYRPGARRVIGVDLRRARDLIAFDFEMALARERARARFDAGVGLVESEQAAAQALVEYALERAGVSEEVERRLGRAARRALRLREAGADGEEPAAPQAPLPRDEAARMAELIARFAEDPERFYWTVERELVVSTSAVRLAELEDLVWARGDRLEGASCPPGGPYCRLGDRRLRPELVSAARAVAASGGLERVRETLSGAGPEAAEALRKRARAWLGR